MARTKKSPQPARQKTVSFRLPEDLMQEMRRLAKDNRRTLSGEVQLAMEKHLHADGFADSDGKKSPNHKA
jgi:hypothetical protein